jgi:hypothetical protein
MLYRSKNVKEAREKEGERNWFNPAHSSPLASFTKYIQVQILS